MASTSSTAASHTSSAKKPEAESCSVDIVLDRFAEAWQLAKVIAPKMKRGQDMVTKFQYHMGILTARRCDLEKFEQHQQMHAALIALRNTLLTAKILFERVEKKRFFVNRNFQGKIDRAMSDLVTYSVQLEVVASMLASEQGQKTAEDARKQYEDLCKTQMQLSLAASQARTRSPGGGSSSGDDGFSGTGSDRDSRSGSGSDYDDRPRSHRSRSGGKSGGPPGIADLRVEAVPGLADGKKVGLGEQIEQQTEKEREAKLARLCVEGNSYLLGVGRAQDLTTAFRCFMEAAQAGFAPAQHQVGRMFLHGAGTVANSDEALSWFRRAADQGHGGALNALGIVYETGSCGVVPDNATAAKYFDQAAHEGDVEAMVNVAYHYEHGLGVDRDEVAASGWLAEAAHRGFAKAQNNLGVMLFHGRGVPQSREEALRWFVLAAQQGHAPAIQNAAFMYETGTFVERNATLAAELYSAAASVEPTGEALTRLACIRAEQGQCDEAVELLSRASLGGHSSAYVALGELYERGWRCNPSRADLARSCYAAASDAGDPRGIARLAALHFAGVGVPENHTLAFSLFLRAAAMGDAEAQNNVGVMYRDGDGTFASLSEAQKWFEQAAVQDEPWALFNLAELYELGRVPATDATAKAAELYTRASELGNPIAEEKLVALRRAASKRL
eukprot:TRINITY_DN6504_c0_g1_i2.p1 TRINITY_DN6504_c0_g1~~TRINITY_DN6504_c0_g1_i2.p1  ORF type:complete len:694 (-),score=169.50 TRINITY_DN6504_c0_g1_i2:1035-3050(-)